MTELLATTRWRHRLVGQVIADHPDAVEGSLEGLSVQLLSSGVSGLLEHVDEGEIVGEEDDLPLARLLGEPSGDVVASLVIERRNGVIKDDRAPAIADSDL